MRAGVLAIALLTAALVGAAQAQAALVGTFDRSGRDVSVVRGLKITGGAPGEDNAITIELEGVTPSGDTGSTPLLPTSLLVTDAAAPLTAGTPDCAQLTANSARCAWPQGFDLVYAVELSPDGDHSIEVKPNASAALTDVQYELVTGEGNDTIKVPAASYAAIGTGGGNDDITIGQQAEEGGHVEVAAGAGDDTVTAYGWYGSIDCGDGIDAATVLFADRGLGIPPNPTGDGPTGCETTTPY
jgi:hypothetical protein